MSVSTQLAQIFSIYFILIGLSMMINRSFFGAAIKEISSSSVAMLIIGTTTLMLGLVLVTLHNVWVSDWRISVTLFCWLVMLSGTIRTLFPTFVQGMAGRLSNRIETVLPIMTLVCITLGLMYGYFGFYYRIFIA
jgi:uncharacterized protein YjeT (DUF2065 family)